LAGEQSIRGFQEIRFFTKIPLDTIIHAQSINIGDTIRLPAWLTPWLAQQDRIIYDWHVNGPSGGGHFRFDLQTLWHDYFWATKPGLYEIYVTVKDTVNGYSSTSAHRMVQVGSPRIEIVMPPDSAKFTFTDSARAALNIMAVATTVPAFQADSVKWTITPIVGSTLRTKPDPPQGDTIHFRYENMPRANSQFGRKYIEAKLASYNVADSVKVKAFYPKYATNDPDPAHDWPNWYYYWRYTDAVVLGPQTFRGDSCSDSTAGYFLPPEPGFHICDSAATESYSECDSQTWNGIDLFAATERHENQHRLDWWDFWGNHGGYNQAADMDPPVPPDTIIGDEVPDSLEGPGHRFPNFNPLLKDSDGDFHKDFEDLAYDMECNWIRGSADSVDWANPGHQY